MIKQFSPKEYDALQRMTVEALMKSKNVSYEELYKKYEDQYRSQVSDEYTMEDILEEITADGATAYLNDVEFAENVARQNSSLAKKIADFFRDIADVLKQIINDRGVRSVGRVMRENAARYRTAANTWYQALEKSGNMYKEGYSAKADSGEKMQIKETDDGIKYVEVDVDQEMFDNLAPLEKIDFAKEILKERFKGKTFSNGSIEAKLANRSYDKFGSHKGDAKYLNAKSRTSTNLDEIFSISEFVTNENNKGSKHLDAKSWDYYRTLFKIGDEFYTGLFDVKKTNNGNTIYDLKKINEVDIKVLSSQLGVVNGASKLSTSYDRKISLADKNVNIRKQLNEPYSPQDIRNAKELLDITDGTKEATKEEVKQAKVKLVLFSHNKDAAEQLGISDAEYNKKLMNWAMYPESARKLSLEINDGVPIENRWSGLENSSILTAPTAVSESELANLTGEIKGDTTGKERNYITRVMLAADTHINYKGLNFEFTDTPDPNRPRVHGEYNRITNTIRVQHNAKNTVAHEMGHYIDALWAAELTGNDKPNGQLLSMGVDVTDSYLDTQLKYGPKYADAADDFINHYDDFIDRLQQEADKRSDYMQRKSEVFARFFSEFVKWTESKPWDMGYQPNYQTQDAFTEEHFKEFAHILQEKSALDNLKENKATDLRFQLNIDDDDPSCRLQ